MSRKFIYNPVDNEMEVTPGHENDPKTLGEKILEKGFKEKPVTNAEMGIKPKKQGVGSMFKKKNDSAGGYVDWWDRIETKEPPATAKDWKEDNLRWKKHLADLFAQDHQTIFYNKTTGKWMDKWGEDRTAKDAVKEQQEIQQTYDGVFTPQEQKQYQEGLITPVQRKRNEFQKKKIDNLNKQQIKNTKIGTIKNLDQPNKPLVKEFRNDDPTTYLSNIDQTKGMLIETLADARATKKSPTTFDAMVKTANKDELKELKKDYPNYPGFELERLQKKTSSEMKDNSELMNSLEEISKMKLRGQIMDKKFEQIMTTPDDPDLKKGINSITGNESIREEFNKLPKFKSRSDGYEGIGLHLTGEKDS